MNQWTHLFCAVLVVLSGTTPAVAQATPPYSQTVIVSSVAGNPLASGGNLLSAVASISSPSASNRWLIKIEPGVYSLGTNRIFMQEYVDIEGSGRDVTRILGAPFIPTTSTVYEGIFNGADNSELRNLSVECTANQSNDRCVPVHNFQTAPSLRDLRLKSQSKKFGGLYGIRNFWSSPRIENVSIELSGGTNGWGILNRGPSPYSHPTVRRTQIRVTGASTDNVGIGNRDGSTPVEVTETSIFVDNGDAAGVKLVSGNSFSSGVTVIYRNVDIEVGSNAAVGYGFQDLVNDTDVSDCRIKVDSSSTSIGASSVAGRAIHVRNCEIEAGDVWHAAGGGIFSSRLLGSAVGGTTVCAGVTDANYVFYPSSCP